MLIGNGLACLQNPAKVFWPKHRTSYVRTGFLFMGQIRAGRIHRPTFTSSSPTATQPWYNL